MTAGSPLFGYKFITNGKSPLNGQKRALLKVVIKNNIAEEPQAIIQKIAIEKSDKPKQIIDANYVRTVNTLAREKFKLKIMQEIMFDLMVCEIEGWSKSAYIKEIKDLISGLGQR